MFSWRHKLILKQIRGKIPGQSGLIYIVNGWNLLVGLSLALISIKGVSTSFNQNSRGEDEIFFYHFNKLCGI